MSDAALQRPTLAATSVSYVVVLDVSVVNVALENLARGLSIDVAGLQWIVNAYTLAFAGLLLDRCRVRRRNGIPSTSRSRARARRVMSADAFSPSGR